MAYQPHHTPFHGRGGDRKLGSPSEMVSLTLRVYYSVYHVWLSSDFHSLSVAALSLVP
jgi:hypothetical protein